MSTSVYFWWGKNQQGRWTHGRTAAPHAKAVQDQLRVRRIRVCLCFATGSGLRSVQPSHITRISRQLAVLLHAGLPLLQALRLMAQGIEHQPQGQLLMRLSQHIESGQSLSDAMRRYKAFDATFCHLVSAGESSGQLEEVLSRLALHREKTEALQRRLRSALLYPSIVLCMGVAVSALLLGFVVPTFEPIFHQAGAELPPLTRLVLQLSRWLTEDGFSIAGIIFLIGGAMRHVLRHTERGQRVWDHLRLGIPIWKALTQHALCARWSRTLSTLLQAGIPIHDALHHLRQVLDHHRYREATQTMQHALTQGHGLTRSMQAYPELFETMMVQMCAVGEESGTLDTMLSHMATHHEQAVDMLTEQLSTLLEPAIMVVLGMTMGTLVLAMYWPIFEIGQVL